MVKVEGLLRIMRLYCLYSDWPSEETTVYRSRARASVRRAFRLQPSPNYYIQQSMRTVSSVCARRLWRSDDTMVADVGVVGEVSREQWMRLEG
jgi:hypothetical protein